MIHQLHRSSHPVRELGGLILAQASSMATIVLAVVNAGLSPFLQALIIAICSALITGIFTVGATWVAIRFAKPAREEVKEIHETVKLNEEREHEY